MRHIRAAVLVASLSLSAAGQGIVLKGQFPSDTVISNPQGELSMEIDVARYGLSIEFHLQMTASCPIYWIHGDFGSFWPTTGGIREWRRIEKVQFGSPGQPLVEGTGCCPNFYGMPGCQGTVTVNNDSMYYYFPFDDDTLYMFVESLEFDTSRDAVASMTLRFDKTLATPGGASVQRTTISGMPAISGGTRFFDLRGRTIQPGPKGLRSAATPLIRRQTRGAVTRAVLTVPTD